MKTFIKILLTLTLLNTLTVAAPAISGTRTFTQPDGTRFEGILKGDSSFHWIESNGHIVICNPDDKFYYKAILDIEKGLVLTNTKPEIKIDNLSASSSLEPKKHDITQDDKDNLYILYKKSKTGHHPK